MFKIQKLSKPLKLLLFIQGFEGSLEARPFLQEGMTLLTEIYLIRRDLFNDR